MVFENIEIGMVAEVQQLFLKAEMQTIMDRLAEAQERIE